MQIIIMETKFKYKYFPMIKITRYISGQAHNKIATIYISKLGGNLCQNKAVMTQNLCYIRITITAKI